MSDFSYITVAELLGELRRSDPDLDSITLFYVRVDNPEAVVYGRICVFQNDRTLADENPVKAVYTLSRDTAYKQLLKLASMHPQCFYAIKQFDIDLLTLQDAFPPDLLLEGSLSDLPTPTQETSHE